MSQAHRRTSYISHRRATRKRRQERTVKQVRRCKHRSLAWAILEHYLTRPGVLSTLKSNAHIHHSRPGLKANGEEKKGKIQWTENIGNLHWREALNKLEKTTNNCQVIHYQTLTSPTPTYHRDWSASIFIKWTYHRPTNRIWKSQEATQTIIFFTHSDNTNGCMKNLPPLYLASNFQYQILYLRL